MRQAEAGQMMLLRSLSQAYYSSECEGHFGLASEAYAHFTSPIRRYPDLLVHRALWNHWNGKSKLTGLDQLAESSSEAERRAVQAERDITQLAACLVARRRIGEEMESTVVGVHPAGLFVRPNDLYADGLVPMEQLSRRGGEYFEVLQDAQTVVGRNSRSSYGLGDSLKVKLVGVNLGMRRINFELASIGSPVRTTGNAKNRRETKKPASGKPARRKSGKKRK
jgi:ribonuclease R